MKVQIEIPTKAVNMAIDRISRSESNDKDLNALEQAVSRCNEETTEIDLSDEDDEDLFVLMMLAMVAIVKRGEEIEKEKNINNECDYGIQLCPDNFQ